MERRTFRGTALAVTGASPLFADRRGGRWDEAAVLLDEMQVTEPTGVRRMRSNQPGPADDGRFRVLFEHSSDAHLIFDAGGVTDCNPAALRLLGAADRAAVLAVHPAALSPEYQPDGRRSDEKVPEMDALARANGWHRFEWVLRRLDGGLVPVEVTLNPVEVAGRPALIVVWHDLTAIKLADGEGRTAGTRGDARG